MSEKDQFTDKFGTVLKGDDIVIVSGQAIGLDPHALFKAKVVKVPPEESAGPWNVLCEVTIRFVVCQVNHDKIVKVTL